MGKWLLFGILCLAVGGGAWNFARNTENDEGDFRPFQSYSLESLQTLISAYDAEIEVTQQRYLAANSNRAIAENRSSLNERLAEFERVQKVGRATRDLAAELAEKQVAVKAIHEEIEWRKNVESELASLLKRVFVYRPDS